MFAVNFNTIVNRQQGRAGVADQEVREDARELVEHMEELTDMLLMRQARTLRRRLSKQDGEQGQLQAPTEDGEQVPVEA
jgi:hypothetical protein